MEVSEFVRPESAATDDIEALYEGRVFHVTRRENWEQIRQEGFIRSNPINELPTTFGSSGNSFFRKLGCVCVFDYRAKPDEMLRFYRGKCRPLSAAIPGGSGIAILILEPSTYDQLVPWTKWKEQEDQSQMVVPYVEAGYPGHIPLDLVEHAIHVRIEVDPRSLMAILRQSRPKATN